MVAVVLVIVVPLVVLVVMDVMAVVVVMVVVALAVVMVVVMVLVGVDHGRWMGICFVYFSSCDEIIHPPLPLSSYHARLPSTTSLDHPFPRTLGGAMIARIGRG